MLNAFITQTNFIELLGREHFKIQVLHSYIAFAKLLVLDWREKAFIGLLYKAALDS